MKISRNQNTILDNDVVLKFVKKPAICEGCYYNDHRGCSIAPCNSYLRKDSQDGLFEVLKKRIVKVINKPIRQVLKDLYLDYSNNYITTQYFADAYNISKDQAISLIEVGKQIHNEDV